MDAHTNVNEFDPGALVDDTKPVLVEESRIVLSAEEYAWFVKQLDEPPAPKPRLREAVSKPPVWDL